MKMKREKGGSNNQTCSSSSSSSSLIIMGNTNSFKPSWLLSSLSDLEERMKTVAFKNRNQSSREQQNNSNDTFAERAEAYYQKRPQLLSLLQDLYHAYLSLAHRYSQTLSKRHHHHHGISNDEEENESSITTTLIDYSSSSNDDAQSSLSYQQQQHHSSNDDDDMAAVVVAELVMKSVENDILSHELGLSSSVLRKIELQRSLLEVLESERLILLKENGRLGYRVSALVEENRGLAAESVFIKRKAGELARCLLKTTREERRACMLGRKIEDLQRQIHGLEKRNKDYYEQLLLVSKKEDNGDEDEEHKKSKNGNDGEVTLEDCFHVDQEQEGGVVVGNGNGNGNGGKKVSKWWGRVKNFDLFMCGPHSNFTC